MFPITLHSDPSRSSAASAPVQQSTYRPDIDGLRAIAITLVLGFHAFPQLLPGGFIGVDIFFVISGFLITRTILADFTAERFSLREFYGRRIRRIFPALLVVLIAVLIAGWYFLLAPDFRELSRQVVSGTLFCSNFLFWQESGYFDAGSDNKPLLHLWSLGVEEQFYILWPVLLYVMHRLRWKIGTLLFPVVALSLLINVFAVERWPSFTFYLPFTRFWELGVGGILAEHLNRRPTVSTKPDWLHPSIPFRDAASAVGLTLILVAAFAFDQHSAFPGWRAILPTTGAAMLIAAGAGGLLNRSFLRHPVVVFVGLISYPVYMWHWPLLTFARLLTLNQLSAFMTCSVIVVSTIAGWLTYIVIERPVRRIRDHLTKKTVAFWLTVAMATIASIGAAGVLTDGAPARFPAIVRSLQAKFDLGAMSTFWRREACFFLDPGPEFRPECVDEAPIGSPLIALWGDSHAAALYPGIRSLQKDNAFRLAQFTIASCPPIIDFEDVARPGSRSSECSHANMATLSRLAALKPRVVVLSAYWYQYSGWSNWQLHLRRLSETIARLHSAGIPKVIVTGSVPVYPAGIQNVLHTAWSNDPLHQVPRRTALGLAETLPTLDRALREVATSGSAQFLSIRDLLCDPNGCLTRVGDDVGDLLTWDNSHLSPNAAKFVMRAAAPMLLDQGNK